MNLDTRFCFHPVGQGMFSTGALSNPESPCPQFWWGYDCGTVKRWQRQLEQEIARFAAIASSAHSASQNVKPKLDLLFLSHFDLDHVSGLVRLLEVFDVEVLVLPYVSLWQRVVAAIGSKRFENPRAQAFFVNPVAFIAGIENAKVSRIVLVLPSRGEAGLDGDEGSVDVPGVDLPNNVPPMRVTRVQERPFDGAYPEEGDTSSASSKRAGPQVMWMESGGRFLAHGCWEFVPYNDPKLDVKATPQFRLAVQRIARDLLVASPAQRAAMLGKLKAAYIARFGKSSKNKNEISLYVFGGPTRGQQWRASTAEFGSLRKFPSATGPCESGQCPICSIETGASHKGSILYTGDGFLKTKAQLLSLSQFLGSKRMATIGTLQVMHHGSRHSWRSGLAGQLAPLQSVFCADRTHTHRHPHQEVWDEFASFGGVLVNAESGMTRFQRA